ncbi:putative disease resistance protein RGA3 [Beta vulgaris subsp. vulgaris]|uniref:putative disease resistance protein RGA3 n=1 Tax=Beta vulgaris subsp. vulgaris TaxID=3555 RepID=UPI000901B3EF|nr:putative disease resistance protein RGA3 [Beta vulgaris subsp. vulgaris]
MAELGLAVVQTLFAALQCSELKEICSKLNYKSQLEDLEKTVTAIKNVLLDADSILELSNEARGYIEDLKDVVYDADDLFDEFLTRIGLKQIRVIGSKRHHEIIEKVRCFFSPNNQASQAYKMCRQVEKIRKKLDAIVDNRKFSLNVNTKSISKRRKGSCAYVDVKDIIGRDDEKKDILDKLLDSNHQDVCFLTIVGVGGLGKTALAQLVFNDEKMIEFANLRFWVCVSDQEKQQFDVKTILCKILESVTGQRFVDFDGYTMQIVIEQFRLKLGGKKYLLVLDDVWNENREKWVGLQNLLMLGQRGSRVIVTTRSEMTARIIGDGNIYKLGGLSRENSWNLFEMAAFHKGDHQQKHYSEFVEIGSKIVGKCYNIPLAIKVVGSLLYGR